MPASALAGLCVVRISGGPVSNKYVTTLHCRTGAAAANTEAGLQGLADAVGGVVGSDYLPLISNQVPFYDVEVQDLSPTLFSTKFGTVAGTRVNAFAAPAMASLVATLNTGLQGRDNRGRMYWWGLPIGTLKDDGTGWDSSTVADIDAWMVTLFTAITTATPVEYAPVLYHRAATENHSADTVTTITSATARSNLAAQRRRDR